MRRFTVLSDARSYTKYACARLGSGLAQPRLELVNGTVRVPHLGETCNFVLEQRYGIDEWGRVVRKATGTVSARHQLFGFEMRPVNGDQINKVTESMAIERYNQMLNTQASFAHKFLPSYYRQKNHTGDCSEFLDLVCSTSEAFVLLRRDPLAWVVSMASTRANNVYTQVQLEAHGLKSAQLSRDELVNYKARRVALFGMAKRRGLEIVYSEDFANMQEFRGLKLGEAPVKIETSTVPMMFRVSNLDEVKEWMNELRFR